MRNAQRRGVASLIGLLLVIATGATLSLVSGVTMSRYRALSQLEDKAQIRIFAEGGFLLEIGKKITLESGWVVHRTGADLVAVQGKQWQGSLRRSAEGSVFTVESRDD